MHYIIKVATYDIELLTELPREQIRFLSDELEKSGLKDKQFDSSDDAFSAMLKTDLRFIDDFYDIVKIPFKFKKTTPAERQAFINSLRGKR